jgi:hypothetical protein
MGGLPGNKDIEPPLPAPIAAGSMQLHKKNGLLLLFVGLAVAIFEFRSERNVFRLCHSIVSDGGRAFSGRWHGSVAARSLTLWFMEGMRRRRFGRLSIELLFVHPF